MSTTQTFESSPFDRPGFGPDLGGDRRERGERGGRARGDGPGRERHQRRMRWVEAQMAASESGPGAESPRGEDTGGGRGKGRGRGPRGFGPRGFGPGGFPPGFDPGHGPFGPGGPGGFGRRGGGRRGGRGGRGDVRAAILLLLEEQPMHGYELIQRIVHKSGGVWTPSPGSIYPALQQLEDEGLVSFDRVDGRKTASLTDEGKAYVEEHRAELGSPWDDVSGGVADEARDMHQLIGTLMGAVHTVARTGTREQVKAASEVLTEARRSLYRILADDPATPATPASGEQPAE